MKSIKVKPGETFELIVTDDKGNEMIKHCYQFNPNTKITIQRGSGIVDIEMDLVPTINYQGLFAGSKLFTQNKDGQR